MGGHANGSWQTTTLHVDGRGRSACFAYAHRTPIFEVAAGNAVIRSPCTPTEWTTPR